MNKGDLIAMTLGFISVMGIVNSARCDIVWYIKQLQKDIREIKKNLYIMEIEDEIEDE